MFYVYGLIDSFTNKVFYVGKGCKDTIGNTRENSCNTQKESK